MLVNKKSSCWATDIARNVTRDNLCLHLLMKELCLINTLVNIPCQIPPTDNGLSRSLIYPRYDSFSHEFWLVQIFPSKIAVINSLCAFCVWSKWWLFQGFPKHETFCDVPIITGHGHTPLCFPKGPFKWFQYLPNFRSTKVAWMLKMLNGVFKRYQNLSTFSRTEQRKCCMEISVN